MRKVNQSILILMFLALTMTGLGGCTTSREPVALIEPSFSYLRDTLPAPQAAAPLIEAASVVPTDSSESVEAEPSSVDLMSDARPTTGRVLLSEQPNQSAYLTSNLSDSQMVNPMLNIAANTMPLSDTSSDLPEPIAVFVRR